MISDQAVTIAGYSFEITFHDAVVIGIGILISLAFWAILHFDRKRVVYLTHSEATNQIMLELSRIAVTLEDIANRHADQVIASTVNRQHEQEYRHRDEEPSTPSADRQPVPEAQPRGMFYSLFGR